MFVGKKVVLLLVIMLIVSGVFLLVGSCVVADVKPVVPSFTVQEVSQPYDVPPSTVTTVLPKVVS